LGAWGGPPKPQGGCAPARIPLGVVAATLDGIGGDRTTPRVRFGWPTTHRLNIFKLLLLLLLFLRFEFFRKIINYVDFLVILVQF